MGKHQKQASKKYKFKQSMVKNDLYLELSDPEFYGFGYTHLTPSGYGSKIEKRLISKLGVTKVNGKKMRGDFLTDPKSKNNLYGEIKTTYKDPNGFYHITHIRQWHDFDVYVLCFIDPTTCKAQYIMIKKDVLNELPLTNMNLTDNDNQSNNHVEKRISLTEESDYMKFIKSKNLLDSTTFKSFFNYINLREYYFDKIASVLDEYVERSYLYASPYSIGNFTYYSSKVRDFVWYHLSKDFGDQPKRSIFNKFMRHKFNDVILHHFTKYDFMYRHEHPGLNNFL
jgi:hypothetical protein